MNREWHVEEYTTGTFTTWTEYKVVRNDGKVYAYCKTQADAANVCQALNFIEVWAPQQ